ncbi:unnamed protein product, partial [Heterosigma akashiwo]
MTSADCQVPQNLLQNPGDYSCFAARREKLHSTKDLEKELTMISHFLKLHPKGYQGWYHRRFVAEKTGCFKKELKFTEECLTIEDTFELTSNSKNYHSWCHRQWALKMILAMNDGNENDGESIIVQILEDEIKFVEAMIAKDLRNNSAWNHRWFVLHHLQSNDKIGVFYPGIKLDVDYCFKQIALAPHNLSPWLYLRGIIA